ncbi:3_t:CDS:2 [Funneliformis geosporum]|uniref:3_t:CDS:1 n=1 Tax=Funneliformis geosporum TaxID=1117311 RepID=A0A9W4WZD2_9GLOM|nr:3_t:CDS:2 [Funneliformis geosporum]
MSLIHSNFAFLNKPWWRPGYDDRAPHYFISNIERLQQAISTSINNEDELFWRGFMELHRERYLIECISAEGDNNFSKNNFWTYITLAKKVQNFHNAINDIFPYIFFPNLPMDCFTPLLAQHLHQQIGNGEQNRRAIPVMSRKIWEKGIGVR